MLRPDELHDFFEYTQAIMDPHVAKWVLTDEEYADIYYRDQDTPEPPHASWCVALRTPMSPTEAHILCNELSIQCTSINICVDLTPDPYRTMIDLIWVDVYTREYIESSIQEEEFKIKVLKSKLSAMDRYAAETNPLPAP